MKYILLSVFFLLNITLTAFDLQAQKEKSFTLSGYVKDASTGDKLEDANIFVPNLSKGAITDINGYYTITLPQGKHQIRFSYIGYGTIFKDVDLQKNQRIDIELSFNNVMKEIVITSERDEANVQSTDGSRVNIPMEKLKNLPVLFGELDILKTIQLMPGVQSGGEGSSGFYVRGGGPDQNLILLDGATVYNASHLFGFFSVFNSDAIASAELIKGGMPAEFGGRTASVLNITTKEGDMNRYKGDFGLGLISSRASVQGPIVKDKASFQFSARRTYIDILMKPFSKGTDFEGLGYYFYDLNAKLNYRVTPKDNITLTAYYGKDVFSLEPDGGSLNSSIDWGNVLVSSRWSHFFKDNFSLSTTASFTDYQFNIGLKQDLFNMRLFSGVRDLNGKIDFIYLPNKTNTIKWGLDYVFHQFTPSTALGKSGETNFDFGNPMKMYAHEAAAYAQHEFEFGDNWQVNYGLRFSFFAQSGPFTRYDIDNVYDKNVIDSTVYSSGSLVQSYSGIEPRVNLRYKLGKDNSLKASYSRNNQYIHLATMSAMSLPTDAWFPSTSLIKPQLADQVSLGYFQNFLKNEIETSVEVYYKNMQNLIEYRDGSDPSRSMLGNPDYDFTFGNGKSYGVEFFVNKTKGKFTGWVGYTLSWTTRSFPEIMNGKDFYARYDRRHDISVVATYNLTKTWVLSAAWVFSTGNSQTLPISLYIIDNTLITEWGDRNGWRMPNYHRLDLSATWKVAKEKRYDVDLNFSIYNVYNRQNPYYISFEQDIDLATGYLKITPNQVSIFPILPSVSLNIKFK